MFVLALLAASVLADETTTWDEAGKYCSACPATVADSLDVFDTCISTAAAATDSPCTENVQAEATVTTEVDADADVTISLPKTRLATLTNLMFTGEDGETPCTDGVVCTPDAGDAVTMEGSTDSGSLSVDVSADDYAKFTGTKLTCLCKTEENKIFTAGQKGSVVAKYTYANDLSGSDTDDTDAAGFSVGMISMLGAAALYSSL